MLRRIAIVVALLTALAAGGALWWRWLMRRQATWRVRISDAIPVHSAFWRERREHEGDLLYVAIGDSAAQGIGASRPAHGYVGFVADHIEAVTGRAPRVINLGISGATVRMAIDEELPALAGLRPDILTVSIGANDIDVFNAERFRADIGELIAALPDQAIVADLPTFYFLAGDRQVRVANAALREAADARGLEVVPLYAQTRRWGLWGVARQFAGDLFHPNDRGYRVWADTFETAVDARLASLASGSTS